MEHKTLAELERAAETTPIPLTRTERLQRWAEALAKLGPARLNSLLRTEYVAPEALTWSRPCRWRWSPNRSTRGCDCRSLSSYGERASYSSPSSAKIRRVSPALDQATRTSAPPRSKR